MIGSVLCPSCKGLYHETTELYRADEPPHGGMFKLKKRYGPKGFNWDSFPNNSSMRSGSLECPWCGALYGTKPTIIYPNKKLPDVCPHCGKECKSKAGLLSHLKWCSDAKDIRSDKPTA